MDAVKNNSSNDIIEKMIRLEKEFNPNKEKTKIFKKLNQLFMPIVIEIYQKKRVTKIFRILFYSNFLSKQTGVDKIISV